jgi:LacI family transcriptional regulator
MPHDVPPVVPPTMHEIAARAGVGKATVSLALRDDPRLRPETRRRIQRIAAKMGYRPNPTISNLMAQLRASRTPKYQATLGLLRDSFGTDTIRPYPVDAWFAGCAERAAQLGYKVETFSPDAGGKDVLFKDAGELASELDARNIRGVAVTGVSEAMVSGFPWERFAAVSPGRRLVAPGLNFSTNDHFGTAFQAARRLAGLGYRRIALVIDPELDAAVEKRYSGGFLAAHDGVAGGAQIPVFAFGAAREAAFRAWYSEHHPEAILTLHGEIEQWVDDPGHRPTLTHLDLRTKRAGWSGMRQNHAQIGAAAVDLLIGQLHRNETGLPALPQGAFIQSTWVDAATSGRLGDRAPADAAATAVV